MRSPLQGITRHPLRAPRLPSLTQLAIAILRKFGTDAHVYLPGANGVAVSGLLSNNYTLSNGSTGYSAVDGTAGLVLDGAGSVGPELVTNGDFSDGATGWTASPGTQTSALAGAAWRIASVDGSGVSVAQTTLMPTVGKTYKVSVEITATAGSGILIDLGGATSPSLNTVGVKEFFLTCTSTVALVVKRGGVCDTTFDNVSVKEVTGIHITQSTTASKPALRGGLYNLLLNSATPATQSVTCAAAPYTLALYGTGSVALSGTGSGTLNGTGASDLVVLNFTPTAGSVTFTKSGTVSSFGLFQGTLTAAQILAEGGIPLTTSTAASNSGAGRCSWQFDGVNDSLALSSVPFQMSDDHCVIAGARADIATASCVFGLGGAGGQRIAVLYSNAGTLVARWTDDAAANSAPTVGSGVVTGTPFVATARKVGSAKYARLNGSQTAAENTAVGTTTVTTANIGWWTGVFHTGAIGPVIVIKGTISDSDLLTLERWAASLTPNGPTF